MCEGCWEEHGSPKIDNAKVRAAARLVRRLYETFPTGGNLHIITDDWNISDRDIEFCSGFKSEMKPDELACLNAFSEMTKAERASALGLVDEFWEFDTAPGA